MDADAVTRMLAAVVEPKSIEFDAEHQVLALPEGSTVVDLKPFLPPPARVRQEVHLHTVGSFVEYVKTYGQPGVSIVFADEPRAIYDAALDYHRPSREDIAAGRGACEHRAVYACPRSPQWQVWKEGHGKWSNQIEFAGFIESNLRDIVLPAAADLLQVALELQVHKSAEFESEVRLDNGQNRFRYAEIVKGTSKAGDLDIPSAFKLRIPVFIGGAEFEIDARFRYRMTEGKLTLGYELIRSHEVYLAAVAQVTKEIQAGLGDMRLFVGSRS